MFEFILSLIAVFFLLFISVYTIIKSRSSRNVYLSLTTLLLAAIEISDYITLHMSHNPISLKSAEIFLEALLPMTFILFSLSYARRDSIRSLSVYWRVFILSTLCFPVSVLVFPASDFFFSPDILTERMLFLGTAGYWFYMGMILYCTVALVNLEMTFSAASKPEKENMKFEFIGMSSILAVLIFYFSQGLLYRSINMNLVPIRSGVFIVASSLLVYSKLFGENGTRVVISRYIVYKSVTLTLIGSYLLVLGLIGEGMKYFNISFSRDLTIFLAFATGILMLFILLSSRLRRRAKVFINKNFFKQKHDYRNAWLNFTGRLASCRSFAEVQNTILNVYRGTFGLKGASLYLIDRKTKRYALSADQMMASEAPELSADAGLISYFASRQRVFNPYDGEYVPTEEEVSFIDKLKPCLIVPLIGNGAVEGFVTFGEQLAPEEFVYEDYDLMKTVAKQAALSIINCRLSEEITETREIAAVGRISSFVAHDLKNLATTFALTLHNAEEYIQDAEFQNDMIMTMKNTLDKINSLIQRLRSIRGKETLNKELADIDLMAKNTVNEVIKLKENAMILYHGSTAASIVDTEEIKSVILNLILNALDSLDNDGVVEVETGTCEDTAFIRVKDNGCGMTQDFIDNHLFRPFRTTKEKGLGIGLYQCKQIIEAHGGRCEAESSIGKGSVFTVYLPWTKETMCTAR
jgi:putative PEP-CTERM system histidine kinase